MKPHDVASFCLIILLSLAFLSDTMYFSSQVEKSTQEIYSDSFKSAVDDMGAYMSELEAQQIGSGVRYSKEKELNMDLEIVNMFYANLALKLGVEGDPRALQDLMLHIPAMAFVRYDGYNIITLTSSAKSKNDLEPVILPLRPFTYTLPSGNVVHFTLDSNLKLYDPTTNQFLEGTYDELKAARDLSPMTTKEKFEETRKRAIANALEEGLGGAVNRHMQLVKNIGLSVEFTLPSDPVGDSVDNLGFYAFMQGYPLPGGELLTSYSFGGGQVQKRTEYAGVIRSDGRHVAYDVRCGVPSGSVVIETIYSAQEAAKKGYFIEDCGI